MGRPDHRLRTCAERLLKQFLLNNTSAQASKPWGPGRKAALAFGIIVGLGVIGGAAWGIALASFKHY